MSVMPMEAGAMSTRTMVCCVLLAAVPLMASCARRESQERSVFSTDLDPEVEAAVQKLKEKTQVPIDEETRRKIAHLVRDLSRRYESADTEVVIPSVDAAAARQLEALGAPAIPYLIDAAGMEQAPIARQYALAIVQRLAQKTDTLLEFVPVFVRSMSDRDSAVRGAAIAQIGISAREFHRNGQSEKLDALIPYLVKGFSDDEETVHLHAASCLIQIGRKDLVPQKWIEDGRVGGFQP